jgi:hypothetical protein
MFVIKIDNVMAANIIISIFVNILLRILVLETKDDLFFLLRITIINLQDLYFIKLLGKLY